MKAHLKSLAPFFAVLWLTFGGASTSGVAGLLVLCQGQDGHVEIELAVDGACADKADETAAPAVVQQLALTDDCGSCTDTLLNPAPAWHAASRSHEITPIAAAVLPAQPACFAHSGRPLTPALAANPPPVRPNAQVLLESVRLLI